MRSFPEEKLFYIKFKGQRDGPFPFREIRKKYLRREFGGLHYLVTADESIPLSRIFGNSPKQKANSSLALAKRTQEEKQPSQSPRPRHWVWVNDRQQGPFTLREIQTLLEAGKLGGQNLLWLEHSQSWRKIEEVLPTNTW
ncbi:MAG: DUF4339 domain-containing protein [Opitutales bacterium]|nr:DUF4339 domain-containing protein [Opitutales bacterium]